MRKVLALFLLVLASMGVVGAAYTADIEPSIDRPGGDIAKRELRIPAGVQPSDPRDPSWGAYYARRCKQACERNRRCVAWTMVKAGVQGPNAMCWLKGQIPPAVSNGCCTSGTIEGR